MKRATEEQSKVLEEYMEQLEQETKTLEPSLDDVFSEQNKRKLFKNKHDMLSFLSMANVAAGQFRKGNTKDGKSVWELVFGSWCMLILRRRYDLLRMPNATPSSQDGMW